MKVAKAKGHLRGKQPKLNRRQEAHLVSLVYSDEYSTAEVADLFTLWAARPSTALSSDNATRHAKPPRRVSRRAEHGASWCPQGAPVQDTLASRPLILHESP